MDSAVSRNELLPRVIREGARLGAERFSSICGAAWKVERAAVGGEAEGCSEALATEVSEAHFGSCFLAPGAAFLVLFDRKSGLRVYARFAGDAGDNAGIPAEKLEPAALSEASNILANAMARSLASACREAILLSAPEPLFESPRELLRAAVKKLKDPEKPVSAGYVSLTCPALSSSAIMVVFLDEDLLRRMRGA